MKSINQKQWLKLIEFFVVSGATWLNPQAGGWIFLLKLCFQILAVLQHRKPVDQPDSKERDRLEAAEKGARIRR